QKEGNRSVKREINHYNLQMIISVGFKVNNDRAVQFRKWAGQVVKNYTIQGWVMDKERLKKGHMFTDEYFERLLQSIREIRLSERKFYQKITDLYTTAFDYGSKANTTQLFFQTVQNKMHWAVHRHTAAELIVERADAELQAERQIPMTMQDWGKRLDSFLEFNGNELLIGSGKISSEKAKLHAETEFEKFRIIQDRLYQSDFDRFLLEGNEIEGQRS
ncbi:MAG TPA: RhuM family protein, partial [Candidatus Cloacimonadota bacterium]|nr:RhuM family protein [Candidatus Cloacimonadota bacterium]